MLVETQNGYKPIADIKIGDMVLARNEFTGQVSYQKVLNQYNNPYKQTVYVTVKDRNGNEQTIVSNKIHPYFTRIDNQDNSTLPPSSEGHNYQGEIKNAQWVDASNLKAGYELLSEDGKWQVVQRVEVQDEPLSAYNLMVDNDHTYFIAGNYKVRGVWVHNNCNYTYEAAPYHGTTSNSVKNKAPSNPQQSLNNSIQIKETSDRRIAVDKENNEFAIFDKTQGTTYHGHVRSWDELTQEMKNILITNGLVNRKGKIK